MVANRLGTMTKHFEIDKFGKAACQPLAGPVDQPLADTITSQWLASGLPQTYQHVGLYSG